MKKISPNSNTTQYLQILPSTQLPNTGIVLTLKISNLCDPDPPTLQTDGQTDDMRSQYRTLHYSASRGKNHEVRPPASFTSARGVFNTYP